MQTYIGVDISKAFFDSSIGVRSMRCANTSSGFCDFMTQLPDDAWIVMECTGNYGSHLADTLVTHGYRVSMVNALQVKRFAQSRSKRAKTDKVDAKLLVEYAE